MKNDLKTLFAKRKEKIIATLEKFLLKKETKALLKVPFLDDLPNRLIEYTKGGKCLRGNLVLLGAEAAGADIKGLYPAAAAIELFQSGILMHDDIIDGDAFRRGKPSAHRAFAIDTAKLGLKGTEKLGESLAICLGDIALMLTFTLLLETKSDDATLRKVASFWGKEFAHVGAAEMEDAYLSLCEKMPEEKRIMALYEGKTAGYTFTLPLLSGVMLGGGKADLEKKLAKYALALGVLFQIRDDELGLFGNEAKLGKPVGSDIRENKKTLFTQRLFSSASKKELAELKKIFGSQTVGEKEVAYVRELLEKKGIRSEINGLAEALGKRAERALLGAKVKSGREYLSALIELSKNRNA